MVRQFIFDVFQNTNGFTNFTVDQINIIIPIKGAVNNNSKKSTRFYQHAESFQCASVHFQRNLYVIYKVAQNLQRLCVVLLYIQAIVEMENSD